MKFPYTNRRKNVRAEIELRRISITHQLMIADYLIVDYYRCHRKAPRNSPASAVAMCLNERESEAQMRPREAQPASPFDRSTVHLELRVAMAMDR